MFSWNFKSTLKNYFNTIQPGRGQRWQEYKTVEKVYDISLVAGWDSFQAETERED